jgi:hypothetical protein
LGVVSRFLLANDCLASVSPPSLGVGWASEPEARRASPPPLLLNASGAAGDGPP